MAKRTAQARKQTQFRPRVRVLSDSGLKSAPESVKNSNDPKLLLNKLLQRRKALKQRVESLEARVDHSRGRNRLNQQALLRIALFRLRWYDGRIKGLRTAISGIVE
jgi:hypothetical protein